jgi:hypothetical protein
LKKQVIIGLLAVIVAVAAVVIYQNTLAKTSESKPLTGFTMVILSDNTTLLSDADIISFNSTSQEFTLTQNASQRLQESGYGLYNFTNTVSIRVNGEEIYRGIFRNAAMSAVPEPPTIAILYPSITFPEGTQKDNAMRLFYPSFTPPSDMQAMNAKLESFFEDTNRLTNDYQFLPA